MCHRFSLLMFVLNNFLIHFEYIVMSQQVGGEERNPRETVKRISEVSPDWMKEILNVNRELLDVQAVIAKDEESTTNCMTGSRKTNKRHLMCVGSIVNVQHVLTSATCIQEATYIRHNLKAPLVVVVGVLKSNPQVIRVNNYEVHPNHVAFPYNSQHSKHNIAVVKLACRIVTEHFTPVELPHASFTELCPNDNCMVAIIRKVGKTSNVIYDTWAKHIPVSKRKRGLTETTVKLQNNNTFKTTAANIQEELRETLVTPRPLKLHKEQDILPNNITLTATPLSKMEKSMAAKSEKEKRNFALQNELAIGSTVSNIIDEYVIQGDSDKNDKVRLFSIRASDGFQGCPQSGSPVMFGKVQAALVSVSCDDRQPITPWKYTDIFSNLDWIATETGAQIDDSKSRLPSDSASGCSTCIYNFFIDLTGPNDTVNCTNLDEFNEKSSNYKLCASHYERQMRNHLRSVTDKSNSSFNQKFAKFNENFGKDDKSHFSLSPHLGTRIIPQNEVNTKKRHNNDISASTMKTNHKSDTNSRKDAKKIQNKNSKKDVKFQKDFPIISETDKNEKRKKDSKRIQSKNIANAESKNSPKDTKILPMKKNSKNRQMNPNQKSTVDSRKMENASQRDYHRNRNSPKSWKRSKSESHEKIVNEPKTENRLKKQIDKSPVNEFDYSRMKTIIPQASIDYNPLANKFHNLRMLLARLQKIKPSKERQTPLIEKPMEILPHGRFFSPAMKFARNENTSSRMDQQFASNNVK